MEGEYGGGWGEGCWGADPLANLHIVQNAGTLAEINETIYIKFWKFATYMMK